MEAFAIVPLLLMLFLYLAVIGLIIWFAISLISSNRERNAVLKDISKQLNTLAITKKEE